MRNVAVSVLTPTIPGREAMLAECRESVAAQTTRARVEHLVHVDEDHAGFAASLNTLSLESAGLFVLPLCDDDLLLPGCVEALLAHARENTIVYSRPLVWGEDESQFVDQFPPCIPVTALVPKAVWEMLGGMNERLTEREDRDLWERAIAKGVQFVAYDATPTWVYRLGHGGNKSRNGGVAS